MKSFLSALQFLTIIPIKIRYADEDLPKAMIYFPVVGLLLGIVLAGANYFLTFLNFDGLVMSVILVIFLIGATGGLHLDGLADTFDAIASGKDKEEMLRIMRDPHIGTMGALSIACVLLLKISLLTSVAVSLKTVSLILMCVLSRWSIVFAIFLFPYARKEGKAKIFTDGINPKIFILATVIAFAIAAIIGKTKGVFILGVTALSAYPINRFINNRIGGITGDTLGATGELTEIIVLFSIYAMGGINL